MMMAVTGATSAYGSLNQGREINKLDQEAFLKLLITQLSNQDPLRPMEDTEFIAQLAQFSSLEQMQMVNRTLAPFIEMMGPFLQNQTGFSAASWIDRTVTAKDPNPPNGIERVITSTVDRVFFTEDGPLLRVKIVETEMDQATGEMVDVEKDKDIPLAYIISIS